MEEGSLDLSPSSATDAGESEADPCLVLASIFLFVKREGAGVEARPHVLEGSKNSDGVRPPKEPWEPAGLLDQRISDEAFWARFHLQRA